MKYECHFPHQHRKLYHISKAQPNTFFNENPTLITVIDITDNIPVESQCQTQKDAFAGEDVTVCVCSGNFCNQALQIQLTMYPLLITLILTALLSWEYIPNILKVLTLLFLSVSSSIVMYRMYLLTSNVLDKSICKKDMYSSRCWETLQKNDLWKIVEKGQESCIRSCVK